MASSPGLKLLLIPTGWVLGMMAASGVLVAALVLRVGAGDPADNALTAFGHGLALTASGAFRFAGPAVLAASSAAILIAEVFAIRTWLYFAAAGALAALGVWQLTQTGVEQTIFSAVEAAASGLAGGLVYWLTAGRLSGFSSPG